MQHHRKVYRPLGTPLGFPNRIPNGTPHELPNRNTNLNISRSNAPHSQKLKIVIRTKTNIKANNEVKEDAKIDLNLNFSSQAVCDKTVSVSEFLESFRSPLDESIDKFYITRKIVKYYLPYVKFLDITKRLQILDNISCECKNYEEIFSTFYY